MKGKRHPTLAEGVVVGIPGEILQRVPHAPNPSPDFEHGKLPGVLGETLAARLETLEKFHGKPRPPLPTPDHGVWHGQDFSI